MRGFAKVSLSNKMWKLSPSLRDASASMAHSKSLGPWRTADPRVDAEPTLYFGLAVVVRSSTVGMAPMRGAAGARGLNVGAAAVGARAAPQLSKEKTSRESMLRPTRGLRLVSPVVPLVRKPLELFSRKFYSPDARSGSKTKTSYADLASGASVSKILADAYHKRNKQIIAQHT